MDITYQDLFIHTYPLLNLKCINCSNDDILKENDYLKSIKLTDKNILDVYNYHRKLILNEKGTSHRIVGKKKSDINQNLTYYFDLRGAAWNEGMSYEALLLVHTDPYEFLSYIWENDNDFLQIYETFLNKQIISEYIMAKPKLMRTQHKSFKSFHNKILTVVKMFRSVFPSDDKILDTLHPLPIMDENYILDRWDFHDIDRLYYIAKREHLGCGYVMVLRVNKPISNFYLFMLTDGQKTETFCARGLKPFFQQVIQWDKINSAHHDILKHIIIQDARYVGVPNTKVNITELGRDVFEGGVVIKEEEDDFSYIRPPME